MKSTAHQINIDNPLFFKYVLNYYSGPGILLGTRNIVVSITEEKPILSELTKNIYNWKIINMLDGLTCYGKNSMEK